MRKFFSVALMVGSVAFLLGALALALSASPDVKETKEPPVVAAEEVELSGIYFLEGAPPNDYTGSATIVKIRDVYLVHFIAGDVVTRGVGIRHGEHLSVGWSTGERNERRGITVYKVGEKGLKLYGAWTAYPGDGRMRRESLVFIRALPVPEIEE